MAGTDSDTTIIDGLGVAGWGVGGIEAEAAMLGQVQNQVFIFDSNIISAFYYYYYYYYYYSSQMTMTMLRCCLRYSRDSNLSSKSSFFILILQVNLESLGRVVFNTNGGN